MFAAIALGLLLLSFWWRRRMDGWLKLLPQPEVWRTGASLFIGAMACLPLAAAAWGHIFWPVLPTAGYLWHVLVLPAVVLVIGMAEFMFWLRRRERSPQILSAAPSDTLETAPAVNLSRRRFLAGAAVLTPPLVTGALTAVSLAELGEFRTREIDLAVDGWPAELNGFAIAVVADVHTGPFTTDKMLAEIVRRTNTIHNGGPADLVVLPGDLINTSLRDLPQALEMATALRGRLGTVACLGNHDVMDDSRKFVFGVEARGIPVLRDQALTLSPLPGTRIQVLGVRWEVGDPALYAAVAQTAAHRDKSLFPICLAHHPHCWDEAVRRGLPLVLSGHTHGGQLMLTKNIGAGPLKFRYWSGTHRRGNSTLVISNGVGNWFPLRVNAPAEILKITLRAGEGELVDSPSPRVATRVIYG